MFSYHPVIPDDILPSYDLVDMSQYFGEYYVNNIPLKKQNRVVVFGGRGCPFVCSFCHNYFGAKIHYRNPKVIATELEICKNKYNVNGAFFLDEVFTLNKEWVRSLREEINNRHILLELTIQTRVDCIDKGVLHDLVLMGVKNIWLSCYKITVNDGKQQRTIVSSIKSHYNPEQLIGKKILVLVNLTPTRIAGVTSEGMLLAATFNDHCKVIFADNTVPAGCEVK